MVLQTIKLKFKGHFSVFKLISYVFSWKEKSCADLPCAINNLIKLNIHVKYFGISGGHQLTTGSSIDLYLKELCKSS